MFGGFGLSAEPTKKAVAASDKDTATAATAEGEDTTAEEGEGSGDGGKKLTREDMMSFFDMALEALRSQGLRDQVASEVTKDHRPDDLLLSRQLDMLENEMGVTRESGQRQLNEIPFKHRQDKELVGKMREFESVCHEAYIAILQEVRPSLDALRSEGDMTQEEVMEFFHACMSLMATKDTKAKLAARYAETSQPPNDLIIDMQRDTLSILGWVPEYGIECLNKHITSENPEVAAGARRFAMSAQQACQEAVMGKEKFEQAMEQQREQAMRQRRMMGELSSMKPAEQQEFMKRMATAQVALARRMAAMETDAERVAHVQALPMKEQEDLAKFNMLMQARTGGGGHSHSHEHGAHCNHGHQQHGHAQHEHHDHSHEHTHGKHCSHDHSHGHDSD